MVTQYSHITLILHPPHLTAALRQTPSDVDRSGACGIIEVAVSKDTVESLFHYVCGLRFVVSPALMILLTDNSKHHNRLYL